MRAALFEKPHALRIVSRDLRTLSADEILVRVEACGICGTDVHIVEGTSRSTPPVVLGHEFAGVVEDAGKARGAAAAGTRVAVDPNIFCGRCYYCRRGMIHLCENLRAIGVDIDGGMAERCIVPASQAYALPEGMAAETSAFIEPVSCILHGLDRARINAGDTVVILGGGTIGLIMLQLVRNAGAARTVVVEPIAHKRTAALALGADLAIDPARDNVRSAVMDLTAVGADIVMECVGKSETMQQALSLARRGGTVEFFGVSPVGQAIPVEPNMVYFRELTVVGSYVNPHTFARAISLLQAGKIRLEQLRIDRFPLDGVHEGLRFQREGITMKSLITPNL